MPTSVADPSGANYEGIPFVFMSGDHDPDGPPQYCTRPTKSGENQFWPVRAVHELICITPMRTEHELQRSIRSE